jgi:hypothetical protein
VERKQTTGEDRPTLEWHLRQRILQLEALLRRERTARELAEASARRAWDLRSWPGGRRPVSVDAQAKGEV